MPNTYSWVIPQIECYPEKNGKKDVVMTIHWRRQATDGVFLADVYGSQLVVLDPAAPFTPYSDLTQPQVEGWLVDAMGATKVAELDASLDQQIAELIDPPVVTPPLPWAAQ